MGQYHSVSHQIKTGYGSDVNKMYRPTSIKLSQEQHLLSSDLITGELKNFPTFSALVLRKNSDNVRNMELPSQPKWAKKKHPHFFLCLFWVFYTWSHDSKVLFLFPFKSRSFSSACGVDRRLGDIKVTCVVACDSPGVSLHRPSQRWQVRHIN